MMIFSVNLKNDRLMANKPLPLPFHSWHQENLIWRGTEADGALGRKSIQGVIQARLEGSAGGFSSPDIVQTPQQALNEVINRIGFRAAGRVRMIDEALLEICDDEREVLKTAEEKRAVLMAAYWIGPQVGLEAWDSLANLVAFSPLSHRKYHQSRVKMTFGEWVTRLSNRKLGVLGRDKLRAPPKASKYELSLVRKIKDECEKMLEEALQDYVDSFRLVGAGSLVQRVLRKTGRKYG